MDAIHSTPERDAYYMRLALEEARAAAARGEVPVGAVIVRGDEILASCGNRREELKNALSHAEADAIRLACEKLGGWRLPGCELFVTMEPCPMCAGAIVNARLPRVVVAARDARAGAFGSVMNLNAYPLNHKPEIVFGVEEEAAVAVLRDFFQRRRA
ncbi:MAG: nucleoside deaminase [Clostridia bacterium]|nr:nucleoside deaminase [Clostridia bacterium]